MNHVQLVSLCIWIVTIHYTYADCGKGEIPLESTKKCKLNGYTCLETIDSTMATNLPNGADSDGLQCCNGRVTEARECVPCDETFVLKPVTAKYTTEGTCHYEIKCNIGELPLEKTEKCTKDGYTCVTGVDGPDCCGGRNTETRPCIPCDETTYNTDKQQQNGSYWNTPNTCDLATYDCTGPNNGCPDCHVEKDGICYFPSFLDKDNPKRIGQKTWGEANRHCTGLSNANYEYTLWDGSDYEWVLNNEWSTIYTTYKASFGIWIGAKRTEKKWPDWTIDGLEWMDNEPTTQPDEKCASTRGLDGIDDIPCDLNRVFICKGAKKTGTR